MGESNDRKKKVVRAVNAVAMHRVWGVPVMLLVLLLVFQLTFTVGAYPQQWIEAGVAWLSQWVSGAMRPGALRDLLVDGIIAGVGGVLVFVPNILILFFFISMLEDSGYMARAARLVNGAMRIIGLPGKSFIPYIVGLGCSVPAIMATQTLEKRRDRIVTILTIPFMSCSAKLPVYVLLVSGLFPAHQGRALLGVYVVGFGMVGFSAKLLSKTILRYDDTPESTELPPMCLPTARNATRHMWKKGSQYMRKMGTTILVASIIVWALGYFPRHEGQSRRQQVENSLMGHVGKAIEPAIKPLGFNWQMGISLLAGTASKEIVVSTMGVLYTGEQDEATLQSKLQAETDAAHRITPMAAFSFMLFVLLYFPCVATLSAIRREAGTGWMLFSVAYTTVVAWLVALVFYQGGCLILNS